MSKFFFIFTIFTLSNNSNSNKSILATIPTRPTNKVPHKSRIAQRNTLQPVKIRPAKPRARTLEVGFERRSEPVSEPAANFNSDSANEYDSEPKSHIEDITPALSTLDSRNNFSTNGTNREVNDSVDMETRNEVPQEGREKSISINIESGFMSNLEGDLVDSIKEFLNL
jgi:hypothetical protein